MACEGRTSIRGLICAVFVCLVAICPEGLQAQAGGRVKTPAGPRSHAVIETSLGSVEIELFEEDSPRTVENFVKLAERSFFDGMRVHRVVKGVLIQTGDEKTKDLSRIEEWGTGGRNIWEKGFEDEISGSNPLYREGYKKGMVVMANRGPRTNTSQFMVLLKDLPFWPKNYNIFGMVTRGQEVVDSIGSVELVPILGPDDGRPTKEVVVKRVDIKVRSSSKITQVSEQAR